MTFQKLFFFCTLFVSLTLSAAAQQTDETKWTWTGWGGGGFFWCAAFDPTDANSLYMGGDVLGMYKSIDRGTTWKFINNGLQNYAVHSIAVSPSNPKVLYAMTRNGIARSDNGGDSWMPLPETLNNAKNISIHRPGSVRSVAIDPTNPNIVYAGSGSGILFKSLDAGATWAELDYASAPVDKDAMVKPAHGSGFLWIDYQAPAQDWSRHGRIEKFTQEGGENFSMYDKMTAKVYLPPNSQTLKGQLVLQTGEGWTWHECPLITVEPEKWTELTFDLKTVKELENVRLIHILFRRSESPEVNTEIGVDDVVLTSADGKQVHWLGDWETANNLEGWRITPHADGAFATSIRSSLTPSNSLPGPIASITVAESDPNLVFVAHRQSGLFRSSDGGKTWTRPATPLRAANVAIFAKDAKIVYGAFETAGIWKSTDGGVSWSETGETPKNFAVREIVIDPRDPNRVRFIAAQSWNGCFGSSNDGGQTWATSRSWTRDEFSNPAYAGNTSLRPEPLSTPTNLAMSPTEPDTLFISANWTNILSTDGGETWKQRDQGADITCFFDLRFEGGSAFAVAMDEGLYRSDDDGATWHHLLPQRYEEGVSGHQWRVFPQRKPDGQFRIVTTASPWQGAREYPNAVLISEDSGNTWTRATGLPDYVPKANTMWGQGYARAFAVDPQEPSKMYLGIDGDPEEGKSGGGIFQSADGGLSWKQLPNQPGSRRMFFGLAVDPKDSQRFYWGAGGKNSGVWLSDNGGESWTKTSVTDWVFNVETSLSGEVFAGGGNLWKSSNRGKTWEKLTNFSGWVVVGIAVDPQDENRIWCSAVIWGDNNGGGIFRSVDGGKTWQEITGDIPNRKPMVLRYNPQTKELWACGVGIFKTKQDYRYNLFRALP